MLLNRKGKSLPTELVIKKDENFLMEKINSPNASLCQQPLIWLGCWRFFNSKETANDAESNRVGWVGVVERQWSGKRRVRAEASSHAHDTCAVECFGLSCVDYLDYHSRWHRPHRVARNNWIVTKERKLICCETLLRHCEEEKKDSNQFNDVETWI